jgi:hypothetical protein
MAFVDRSRLQRRLTVAAQISYLWATLGVILVCLLWWTGRVGFGGALLGIGLGVGIAFLGYRTEEGSVVSGAGLVLLGALSVGYAFHHQRFTVDLLGLAALVFFIRGFLAARELQGLEAKQEAAIRRQAEKKAGKKGRGKGKRRKNR